MKISRRTVLIIALILGPFLLLALSFPAFVQDNFIMPIALVLLLGWRIVQSVDQQIYWFALVFAVMLYALIHFYRSLQAASTFEQTPPLDSSVAVEQISYWRTSICLTDFKLDQADSLKRDLAQLLATIYASKQFHAVPHEVYSALEQRQLPLPEPVYTFLFPAKASGAKRSIKQLLHNCRNLLRQQIRRWTGREKTEYYQRLEQVLKFMESVMENEDDERFDAHHD